MFLEGDLAWAFHLCQKVIFMSTRIRSNSTRRIDTALFSSRGRDCPGRLDKSWVFVCVFVKVNWLRHCLMLRLQSTLWPLVAIWIREIPGQGGVGKKGGHLLVNTHLPLPRWLYHGRGWEGGSINCISILLAFPLPWSSNLIMDALESMSQLKCCSGI